jgi:D-amino-acid dehydrogenase
MEKKVVILGGGVIGLFSAYFLSKAGHSVTVLDKGDLKGVSSFGNAGMIVPSHVIPLAAPGMISKGISWMFNSKSPFYVQPRVSSELLNWGWSFYRNANQKHVDQSKVALRDISLLSKSLYADLSKELSDFEYEEKGLLMLFQSEKVGQEERRAGLIAQDLGLEVDFLDKSGLDHLNYGIETKAVGGVLYKSDAHLQPNKLMLFLRESLEEMGVEFFGNSNVRSVEIKSGRVQRIITEDGAFEADDFVIAAGAWSAELAKLAGDSIQLLPGKGYSFTLDNPIGMPRIPTILCEGKVAVTPFQEQLRFGGTMEITHVNDRKINERRVEGIVDTIQSFYPELGVQMPKLDEVWMGFRPCSPSGLPYIGRSTKTSNLIFATGHGMMGLSLGPATGMLVKDVVENSKSSINRTLFELRK